MFEHIFKVRYKLSRLHLPKLKISVLVIPDDTGLFHLDLRPLSLALISLHYQPYLLNPLEIIVVYQLFPVIALNPFGSPSPEETVFGSQP